MYGDELEPCQYCLKLGLPCGQKVYSGNHGATATGERRSSNQTRPDLSADPWFLELTRKLQTAGRSSTSPAPARQPAGSFQFQEPSGWVAFGASLPPRPTSPLAALKLSLLQFYDPSSLPTTLPRPTSSWGPKGIQSIQSHVGAAWPDMSARFPEAIPDLRKSEQKTASEPPSFASTDLPQSITPWFPSPVSRLPEGFEQGHQHEGGSNTALFTEIGRARPPAQDAVIRLDHENRHERLANETSKRKRIEDGYTDDDLLQMPATKGPKSDFTTAESRSAQNMHPTPPPAIIKPSEPILAPLNDLLEMIHHLPNLLQQALSSLQNVGNVLTLVENAILRIERLIDNFNPLTNISATYNHCFHETKKAFRRLNIRSMWAGVNSVWSVLSSQMRSLASSADMLKENLPPNSRAIIT